MSEKSHKTQFYCTFDAEIYGGPSWSNPSVRKVRARRITQKKPDLAGGEIAFKFEVEIPDSAFLRLIPDITIKVPDGFWSSQPVQVIVPEPDDETEVVT